MRSALLKLCVFLRRTATVAVNNNKQSFALPRLGLARSRQNDLKKQCYVSSAKFK
jgi:hypothetical protein